MHSIKPIETVYQGYRFRSRLEARWAVFFDAMGVKWEYEKEGYEMPDGTRYLPDFWLPDLKKFVEIKPNEPSFDETNKCCNLAKMTGCRCFLIFGQPWMYESKTLCKCGCGEPNTIWEYRFYLLEGGELDPFVDTPAPWEPSNGKELEIINPKLEELDIHVFAVCRRCPTLGALIIDDEACPLAQGHWSFCGCTGKEPYPDTKILIDAYKAARQARFEHGESPRQQARRPVWGKRIM